MADYMTPTPDADPLDGVNTYDSTEADDAINGADGQNTIVYEIGDGVDSITFAAPRTYQFAGFLDEATAAMAAIEAEFGDKIVRDLMVPRTRVIALPDTARFEDVRLLLREHKVSRLPIYRGTRDNIVGILHAKDLFDLSDEEERHFQLAGGGDVDAVDQHCHVAHQCRHRVGLHRVVQRHLARQRGPQLCHPLRQQAAVVGVEGGAADARGEAGERNAADEEFAVGHGELGHRGVSGGLAGRGVHRRSLTGFRR